MIPLISTYSWGRGDKALENRAQSWILKAIQKEKNLQVTEQKV